jgi:transcriptional regulator with XRE-family HTH domain
MAQTAPFTDIKAFKKNFARQVSDQLEKQKLTVSYLARKTNTSRIAIRRILDPKNTSLTLHTLAKTANGLGIKVYLQIEPTIDKIEELEIPSDLAPLASQLGDAVDRLSYASPPRGRNLLKKKLKPAI